jgi:epoxyqueuosine reductase
LTQNNELGIKLEIKNFAYSQGFSRVGFTLCKPFEEEREHLDKWFSDGFAGPLDYLSQEKIIDPRNVFPEARTAIVVFLPYARPEAVPGAADGSLKLSRYLWGNDYHSIIKPKLYALLKFIQTLFPGAKGRACVDTAPIMERKLASLAGIGWQAKNTLLIAGKQGSWGFIGVLLLDVEIDPDVPFEGNRCGSCSRCIDSCPTNALQPFRLDSRLCLTTWNIERESSPPPIVARAISETGWVAGCDICQEVCPWNKAPKWGDPTLWGGPSCLHLKPAKELRTTSSKWVKITAGTALRRVRHRHWVSILDMASKNKKS